MVRREEGTRMGDSDLDGGVDPQDLSVAIEEYKALWTYYHRTLDERRNLVEWYFKIAALPAAIVAFGVVAGRQTVLPPIPYPVVAAILLVIFLVGLSLSITHAKECGNAANYERAMNQLRKFFRNHRPILQRAIIIGELRSPGTHLTSIKALRGLTLAWVNAAIGTASLALFLLQHLGTSTCFVLWLVVVYFTLVALHFWIFQAILAGYKKSIDEKLAEIGEP